jgi:thioredoxin reductase (NADPH)
MNTPSIAPSQSSFHTAFPGFNPSILERLSHHGIEEIFEASTLLFVRGARNVDMFVVLDGEIEVFENTGQGQGNVVAILTDGQFTGELDLLDSGKPCSTAAR